MPEGTLKAKERIINAYERDFASHPKSNELPDISTAKNKETT
jgi:hypothetical protein